MFRIICCLGMGMVLLTAVQFASAGGYGSSSDSSSDQATQANQAIQADPGSSQEGSTHAATNKTQGAKSGSDSDTPDDTGNASAMPDSDKATSQDRSADLPVHVRGVVMELFPECQVIGVQFNNGVWEVRVFQEDELWNAYFSEKGELVGKSKSEAGAKKQHTPDKAGSSDKDDDKDDNNWDDIDDEDNDADAER